MMTVVLHNQLSREQLNLSLVPTFKFIGVGILWIVFSDLALFLSQSSPEDHFPIFHLEVLKGILFVLVMGGFFFVLQTKINSQSNDIRQLDFFRKNPQAMWIFNLETMQFLEVNDAAITIYGYSREQFLSMKVSDIRPSEDLDVLRGAILELKNGYRFVGRSRHIHSNGAVVHSEISAYSLTYHQQHAGLIMAHDITKQLQVEQAMLEAKASHEKLTNDRLYEVALFNKELQIRIREVNANNDELIEVNKLIQTASRNAINRYEAKLYTNRQMFNEWLKEVSEALWAFDITDPKETFVSKGTQDLFGCDEQLVLDQPNFWERYIHQSDKLRVKRELDVLIVSDRVTVKYRHIDGTRTISQEIRLTRDEDGKVIKILGRAFVI